MVVTATPVASPLDVIVTLVVSDELQVTMLVMSCWLPSLKVPSAVYCCWTPSEIGADCGETSILVTVALVTVRAVEPDTEPWVAVIVVVPGATAVACPCRPAALLIVATAVLDEVQVTLAVMFWLVLSAYKPVAVNCGLVPGAAEGLVGVTVIDTNGFVMVSVVVPEIDPEVAVIVEAPAAEPAVAKPPAVMLAPAEALHATVPVMSFVLPSAKVPVAANCCI